jgi:NitT/TauT family transport system permease protein/sulfonate transport system permease protein
METKVKSNKLGIISIISILIIWQLLSYFGFINTNLLPAPSEVVIAIYKGIFSGSLLNDSFQSLKRVLIGYCIGSILGLLLGISSSLNKTIGGIIKMPIEIIRPIPPIAWIPLSILWFGLGEPSAYFLVSLGAFFPAFTNAFLGISQVELGTVEVARCHGVSDNFLFKKVILPQALPSIFSGLYTGLGISWMIVITAELVGVQSGLGYFIQVSRAQLQIEQVVAGMLFIGVIGYLLNQLLQFVGKRMMPWKWRSKKIGYNE